MLFPMPTLDAIRRGEVTVAFRRWKRPTVKAGGTLTTAVGVLAIDALDEIEPEDITPADAQSAGYRSATGARDDVAGRPGQLYRIRFHVAGPDPRIALREQATFADDDLAALTARLRRLDARDGGPWTSRYLALVGAREGVRVGDLAAAVGAERLAFKTDIRKLKALGLTESLGIGYRLSPRGQAWLDQQSFSAGPEGA